MSKTAKDQCITMVNEDLSSIPAYEMPRGYSVSWYTCGDEKIWTSIQRAADIHNTIAEDLFFHEFPEGSLSHDERQCYLRDLSGNALATATAWEDTKGLYSGYGLIHWMAVVPELQHQGLGKVLMELICRRLISLGYNRACLRTSTLRPDAIALYKRFGFKVISIEDW